MSLTETEPVVHLPMIDSVPQEPEQFQRHKASLITNLLEPCKTLGEETSLLWSEVVNSTLEWQRSVARPPSAASTRTLVVRPRSRVCAPI